MATVSVFVGATDSTANIASALVTAINGTGKFEASATLNDLKITAKDGTRGWDFLDYGIYTEAAPNVYVRDETLAGPTLKNKRVVVPLGQVVIPAS